MAKLNTQQIKSLAREIIRQHTEGIRLTALILNILAQHPETPRNTIMGSVWNLDKMYPDEVMKPERGLFVPARDDIAPPPGPEKQHESAFYEAFADYLQSDLQEVTAVAKLGGSALGVKWGTPDVIGVYRPQTSDRIKFPAEIVSLEVKVLDPRAPVVAFGQAMAYRLFSAKTYIAMSSSMAPADKDRLESLCVLYGVGLLLFQPNPDDMRIDVRVRAQRFSPDMFYVNEIADRLYRHDPKLFNIYLAK